MDHHQNFCLQSLKDAIDDCNNKEVDVNDGKKKTSEEVNRLRKTSIAIEKSHIDKEEKVQEAKIQKEKKTVKFSPTTSKTSNFRSIESQTRILNLPKSHMTELDRFKRTSDWVMKHSNESSEFMKLHHSGD